MNDNFETIYVTLYEEEYDEEMMNVDPDDFEYGEGDIIEDDIGNECIIQSVDSIYIEDNKIIMKCIVDYFI